MKEEGALLYGPEIRPATIGDLRDFLLPFDDETPLISVCDGRFQYVIDDECNGKIQVS